MDAKFHTSGPVFEPSEIFHLMLQTPNHQDIFFIFSMEQGQK